MICDMFKKYGLFVHCEPTIQHHMYFIYFYLCKKKRVFGLVCGKKDLHIKKYIVQLLGGAPCVNIISKVH